MGFRFPAAQRAAMCCLFAILPALRAQSTAEHVVPLAELHRDAVEAARQREANLVKLDRFFSSSRAAAALKAMNMSGDEIRHAVAMLSDSEIASLSERAASTEASFAGGALNNQQLTYIIIALATAVLILVIVVA